MTYEVKDEHGRFLVSKPTKREAEAAARRAVKQMGRLVVVCQDGQILSLFEPKEGEA